jgi:peptidoglycan hydrolase-like protein with peptidoglycan-binding domain
LVQQLVNTANQDSPQAKTLLKALQGRPKEEVAAAQDALVKNPASFVKANGGADPARLGVVAAKLSTLTGVALPTTAWADQVRTPARNGTAAQLSDADKQAWAKRAAESEFPPGSPEAKLAEKFLLKTITPDEKKQLDAARPAKAQASGPKVDLNDDQKKALKETRHLLSHVKGTGGASEDEIREVQDLVGMPKEKQTGKYDADTIQAVRDFQGKNKLRQDGDVGQQTWSALLFRNAKPPQPGADLLKQAEDPPAQPETPDPAATTTKPPPAGEQALKPDEAKLNKFVNDPAKAQAGMKVLTDATDAARAGKLAQALGEGRLPDDLKDADIGNVVDNLRKVDGDQKAVANQLADGLQALVKDRKSEGQLGGFLGANVDARAAYKALQTAAGPAAGGLSDAISRSGDKDFRLPQEMDDATVKGAIDKLKADTNPDTKEVSGKMATALEGLMARRSADHDSAATKLLEGALPGKGAALLAALKDRTSGQLPRRVSQADLAGVESKLAALADKDPVAKEALGQVRELRGYALRQTIFGKVTSGDEATSLFKGEVPKNATPQRLLELANSVSKLDAKSLASEASISFDDAQKAIANAANQLTGATSEAIAKTGGDVPQGTQRALADLETNLSKLRGNLPSGTAEAKAVDAAHGRLQQVRAQALALLALQKIAPPDEAKTLLQALTDKTVGTSIKPDRLKELQGLLDKVDVQGLSREASLNYGDTKDLIAGLKAALTVPAPPAPTQV